MSDDETLWWGKPLDARSYHVFDGEPGERVRSLCGSWMYADDGNEPEVDPDGDTWKDGRDCKQCARKAGVLGGEEE